MGTPKLIFKKNRRYTTASGWQVGKGVWYDTKTGKATRLGEGYYDKDTKKVTQYNSDGTKTTYTREQWNRKRTKDHETRVLQNDRRWGIPYIPEKRMTITIDKNSPTRRNAGATFSENMLDSIAVNAKRAGIPFSTGLALASTESTLGNAKGRGVGDTVLPWMRVLNRDNDTYRKGAKKISYRGYYSPTALISNWTQRDEAPFHAYEYNSNGYLRTTPQPESYYKKDYRPSINKDTAYTFDRKSPLQSGFEYYKSNPQKYNQKDSHYPEKVEANRKELVNYSPEIRSYMQKNNLKADGGPINKDWNSLSLREKSDIMKVALKYGVTTLPEIKDAYNKFAEGGSLENWTMQDEANYRAWREKLPKNLRNTDDRDYDMREAYRAGMQPQWNPEDKSYHLSSRDPKTGRILKAPHHPTYLEALAADAQMGYYPAMDNKGNTYTETWRGNVQYPREIEVPFKAYGGNLFATGGKKNSQREDNTQRAMSYLMSRGMSKIGASAIVGTLQAESGLNPAIHAQMKGDDGEGLAQWTGSRKREFWNTLEKIEAGARKKYGRISNVPLERQLDVVMSERPEITSAINRAKDVHVATDIMLRGYENGSKSVNSMASKQQINNVYGKWNNGYDRQFGIRVGNAKNLLGMNVDTSWMDVNQNNIDALNAQIANIDTSTLPSTMQDIDPALSYKAPVIDWSTIKEDKAPIEEFTYNPNEEKKDNLQKLSTVMGMMGYENPLGSVMQTITDYSNPLMAVANMYAEGGKEDKPSATYRLPGESNILGQETVYRDGDDYYILDKDNHRVALTRDDNWGIEDNPSTWQFKDATGRIYSPHGTAYEEYHTPQEKGLVPTTMLTAALNGVFNLPFQGLEYAATGHGLQEELPKEGDALVDMAMYAPAFKGSAMALRNLGEKGTENNLIWDAEQMLKDGHNFSYTPEDIEILKKHIPEYKKIEKRAKANGTYLKMPDGSIWNGDPREWVMAQSKKVKTNYGKEILTHGRNTPIREEAVWTSTNPDVGATYGKDTYSFIIPKNINIKTVADAQGRLYNKIKSGVKTDDVVYPNLTDDNVLRVANVVDVGDYYKGISKNLSKGLPEESFDDFLKRLYTGDDIIIGKNVHKKALLGNNGEFNLDNPNIFKGLLPFGVESSLYETKD